MKKVLIIVATALLGFVACKNSSTEQYHYSERFVSNIYINTELSISVGQKVIMQGHGFQKGDCVVFRSDKAEISLPLVNISNDNAAFIVTEDLLRGKYTLFIVRNGVEQRVCNITVWLSAEFAIPDHPNTNLKGIVFCKGIGIPGVCVSDGIETTVTDSNGYWWLKSEKANGYVFITLPSGYMPVSGSNITPGYWMSISTDLSVCEQCNFELREVDNQNHTIFFAADLHLANRNSSNADMSQFRDGFIADTQALAAQTGMDNTYVIMLGDLTWDHYWYTQKYSPVEFKATMADYQIPVFNNMGNHDNDPYVQGNFAGEALFKSVLGPSYYSFNIGAVHYIVLDSIAWINTGGAQGIVGGRDYRRLLTDAELDWLRKDLSYITDKSTPIVVCTHCPLHSSYNSSFTLTSSMNGSGTADAMACFSQFKNVHIMVGHTHHNDTMIVSSSVIEHNVAAVCECWWWGGKYSGRSVCADGTPSGYKVFDVKGRNIEWYYKGIGCNDKEQFRTYDMNVVKTVLADYVSVLNKQTDSPRDTAGDDYAGVAANTVYINVWDYDATWSIEVSEGGKPLEVKRVFDRDPLHTITYDIPRVQHGGELTSTNASVRNSHMFAVQASTASSTIDVKITDRFGRVYTEKMTRPKAFNTTMK